jgi:hypothetical protein
LLTAESDLSRGCFADEVAHLPDGALHAVPGLRALRLGLPQKAIELKIDNSEYVNQAISRIHEIVDVK